MASFTKTNIHTLLAQSFLTPSARIKRVSVIIHVVKFPKNIGRRLIRTYPVFLRFNDEPRYADTDHDNIEQWCLCIFDVNGRWPDGFPTCMGNILWQQQVRALFLAKVQAYYQEPCLCRFHAIAMADRNGFCRHCGSP